jgi:hypothetical protein
MRRTRSCKGSFSLKFEPATKGGVINELLVFAREHIKKKKMTRNQICGENYSYIQCKLWVPSEV